jgi:hypothetical protein
MTDASTTTVSASAPIEDLDSLVATANRAAQWSVTADRLKFEVYPTDGLCAYDGWSLGRHDRRADPCRASRAAQFLCGCRRHCAGRGRKPYHDPATAAGLLDDARRRIDADLETVVPLEPDRPGSSPRKILTPEEYRATRVRDQIGWYKRKSMEAAGPAKRLRLAEFLLALAATVITALSTITGKQIPFVELNFDLAALRRSSVTRGRHPLPYRSLETRPSRHELCRYGTTARGSRCRVHQGQGGAPRVVRLRQSLRGHPRG